MKFKTKNNLLIYLVPALAALLVRIILLINWWDSPIRYYGNIRGLDMQFILQAAKWFYNGDIVFTAYRVLLFIILFFNKGMNSPETVIIIQLIGGIIVAPLVAWCTLRIWGKTYWALASGLLSALYAPALMYQLFVLKESILSFFALLSLAAVLWAHKRHFSAKSLWICGMFLAAACICRINAIPFCGLASIWIMASLFKKLKGKIKPVFIGSTFLGLGILTIFIPVSIINTYLTKGREVLPIQLPKMSYIAKVARIAKPVTMNAQAVHIPTTEIKASQKSTVIINMLRKSPKVFSASEIPNNVNYYFLKYKLFPLQYLVGPLLLIPLATTALILLILNRGALRKESILFVFIFSYMLPMCYFVPLARYRLILVLAFCMLAPYPVFAIKKAWHDKKNILILLPIVILAILLYINLPLDNFLRSTDFVSYGKGMQFKTGKPASALPYFYEAYKMAPYKQMTVVNLSDALLKDRNPKAAIAILLPAYKKSPKNLAYRYYLGIAYFFSAKAKEAEQLFSTINPDDMGALKDKYYFFYGASLRMQKKYKAAAELKQKATKDSNVKK